MNNYTNKIKSVLVTGGAGYVGAVLVPKLLEKGYAVKILDWFIYGDHHFDKWSKNSQLIQVKGNIRDKNLVEKELKQIDAVIHLACISNDPSFELDPDFGRSVNYDATLNLFNLAKKQKVQRFIYASSSSVYGIKKENKVTEDLSPEPLTDYSKYKVLCEKYILENQKKDMIVLILRPATICGFSPRLRLDLTVNMLTIQALVSKKITVFGGKQLRPNIHIEDMTDLYVKTLEYPDNKISGKIYNVGYENYAVRTIAQMVKRVLNDQQIKIILIPSNDNRSYKISSEKIKKELGFIPKYSVEDAIKSLSVAYHAGKITDPLTNKIYYNIKTMVDMKSLKEIAFYD